MECKCSCKGKLVDRIIKKFIVKQWPAGGFVFRLDREVELFGIGAVYLRGAGNVGGMCWVDNIEDALDIISKYPHDVKIEVSLRELIEVLNGND